MAGTYFRHRFWSKVDKRGPDECWPWTAQRDRDGYGKFWLRGRDHAAHRVVIEVEGGELPEGKVVCHRCDNPPCVNPAHLFVGTVSDNNRDAVAKGRLARGEARPNTRLTEGDVIRIREMVAEQGTQKHAAELFGLSNATVSSMVRGDTWKHVGGPRTHIGKTWRFAREARYGK